MVRTTGAKATADGIASAQMKASGLAGAQAKADGLAGTQAKATRLAQAREQVAGSVWLPLVPKMFGWAGAFAALALVGSGALTSWLPGGAEIAAIVKPAEAAAATAESSAAAAASSAVPTASNTAPPASSAAPAEDAGAPLPAETAPADGRAETAAITPDGKVILNLADEADLRRLPSIGPTRAKKILELRGRLGKFKRAEDLLRVKGIGRRALARLRPLVVVDAPARP